MGHDHHASDAVCKTDAAASAVYRQQVPEIAEKLISGCNDAQCFTHIETEPIPAEGNVVDIIKKLRQILFPGFFSEEKIDPFNLKYTMGQAVSDLFDSLGLQISHAIRHDCFRYDQPCQECVERGQQLAIETLSALPEIRKTLATDVRAAYEGDPAAKSHDEIIFSYPGIFAIMVYRVAHKLFEFDVPLIPRIMTEFAHSRTGIDIHPGATIGERFVIDHGTGVVIGETAEIGNNVRIYQGVTLGALSLPPDAGDRLRGEKRHPTIEDDVIIYSGATILGGDTIIGAGSVIGGNVWLTGSIPRGTRVIMENPKLIYR